MRFGKILFVFLGLILGLGLGWGLCVHLNAKNQYQFGELTRLADQYGTDKGTKDHGYTDVYEYFLYPIKYKAQRIFEIGIEQGASLNMFRDYFPNAVIYGADIRDRSFLNSDKIKTFVADQSKRDQLANFITAYGGDFDVLLDDGGHSMEQQQVSFGYLFRYVKPGGYYIIEDVHTSLMGADYGADATESNTAYTMINHFMRQRKIESPYMTPEEKDYLTANIEYCSLFIRTPYSITCIVKKKA